MHGPAGDGRRRGGERDPVRRFPGRSVSAGARVPGRRGAHVSLRAGRRPRARPGGHPAGVVAQRRQAHDRAGRRVRERRGRAGGQAAVGRRSAARPMGPAAARESGPTICSTPPPVSRYPERLLSSRTYAASWTTESWPDRRSSMTFEKTPSGSYPRPGMPGVSSPWRSGS